MKQVFLVNNKKYFDVGKIVCVGRNYSEHAKELGNKIEEKPVIFIKPASALIYSSQKIVHPIFSKEMHHEVELVLLIGTTIKNASFDEAEKSIIAYSVGLDMTLRDIQNELKSKGHPWTIAKCFDTSAVVSDFILKEEYYLSLNEKISFYVNDVLKQNDFLSSMIFKPNEIVQYISSLMTLEKGDLIFTGTPAGVSKVNRGDKLFAEIENVAKLTAYVI